MNSERFSGAEPRGLGTPLPVSDVYGMGRRYLYGGGATACARCGWDLALDVFAVGFVLNPKPKKEVLGLVHPTHTLCVAVA